MEDIYLDHNATTQPDPAVVAAMLPFLRHRFGNPASLHPRGRAASAAIETARGQVASLLRCTPSRVLWTSGATEAINLVIKGLAGTLRRGNLVVTAGEHKAVLDAAEAVGLQLGVVVRIAPLLATGELDYDRLEQAIDPHTFLVCILGANNETGVKNDLSLVADLAQRYGALVLCDATQQAGKEPMARAHDHVDFVVASAHKLYGPQGVGVLVQPSTSRIRLAPQIHGGGHQGGLRSGTLNLPGIVGFGKAAELAEVALKSGEPERIAVLRDRLEQQLEKHAGPITINGQGAPRLPNTTNVRIHGVDSEALIVNCPEVAMSSGSACTSAVPQPSHVLLAMGLTSIEAEESVRLSLGRYTTEEEVDRAAELIGAATNRIREINA